MMLNLHSRYKSRHDVSVKVSISIRLNTLYAKRTYAGGVGVVSRSMFSESCVNAKPANP